MVWQVVYERYYKAANGERRCNHNHVTELGAQRCCAKLNTTPKPKLQQAHQSQLAYERWLASKKK